MHTIACSTTAAALGDLNAALAPYNFHYSSSSSSSSSSSNSSSASGGGGASASSACITFLQISKPAITKGNIEAVKALLSKHIGSYTPSGRSALSACVCRAYLLAPAPSLHAHARQAAARGSYVLEAPLLQAFTTASHAHTHTHFLGHLLLLLQARWVVRLRERAHTRLRARPIGNNVALITGLVCTRPSHAHALCTHALTLAGKAPKLDHVLAANYLTDIGTIITMTRITAPELKGLNDALSSYHVSYELNPSSPPANTSLCMVKQPEAKITTLQVHGILTVLAGHLTYKAVGYEERQMLSKLYTMAKAASSSPAARDTYATSRAECVAGASVPDGRIFRTTLLLCDKLARVGGAVGTAAGGGGGGGSSRSGSS